LLGCAFAINPNHREREEDSTLHLFLHTRVSAAEKFFLFSLYNFIVCFRSTSSNSSHLGCFFLSFSPEKASIFAQIFLLLLLFLVRFLLLLFIVFAVSESIN